MISVYTITYNEEVLIEKFINHYRNNFKNCKIIIYDNYSTDRTVEIAKSLNCDVVYYDTNNKLSDSKYLDIKNNVWKTSETDWVAVCDCDELLEINEEQLLSESSNGVNLIKFNGVNIVNNDDNIKNLDEMVYGVYDENFSKTCLFNKKFIKDINYSPGCHSSNPQPSSNVVPSKNNYRLIHFKYIGIDYTVNRYQLFASRLSDENKIKGWGYHYQQNKEKIIDFYNQQIKKITKVL